MKFLSGKSAVSIPYRACPHDIHVTLLIFITLFMMPLLRTSSQAGMLMSPELSFAPPAQRAILCPALISMLICTQNIPLRVQRTPSLLPLGLAFARFV